MKWLLAAALGGSVLAPAALAQPPPGVPLGPPCFTVFALREGPNEVFNDEHQGPLPLPCPVTAGFVVLVDSFGPTARYDPAFWSDVVAFTNGGPVVPYQSADHVFMISDTPDPTTGIENGITPADLAVAGLVSADVFDDPTTVYMLEGMNALNPMENDYTISLPGVPPVTYQIFSDPPEGPTPARPSTWGRIKALYR